MYTCIALCLNLYTTIYILGLYNSFFHNLVIYYTNLYYSHTTKVKLLLLLLLLSLLLLWRSYLCLLMSMATRELSCLDTGVGKWSLSATWWRDACLT